ncbi:sulfotransferase family protein [Nitzschia inconspicua]|uniref:Sulfotransferase family protein n=1 Tax=Nitzschia inconspicua TaxID=303405 RepID=A0A9K3KWY6_9STRA|nr:sulfotransferase family protein [Nitzschia inconspicua]
MAADRKKFGGQFLALLSSFHGWVLVIGVWMLASFFHQINLSDRFQASSNYGESAFLSLMGPPKTLSSTTPSNKKTLGRTIVERSYRRAYRDLTTEICPVLRYPNVTQPPPTKDFYVTCLDKAKSLGNKKGTSYHDRWPWWFRTLLRDTAKKYNGIQGPWHVLQFSEPDLRLCVYEKGGTKKFKQFHCRHIHNYTGKYPEFNQCWNQQPKYATKPKSDKAVFLRDPLDRFLSGFLDKCIEFEDEVDHCEPTTVFHDEDTSPVSGFVSNDPKRFFDIYVDTFPLQWNMHFIPQAFNCGGLYRDIDQYSFVGNMGVSFYRDLDRLKSQYPKLEQGIEEIFQLTKHGKADKINEKGVETGAAGQVLDYYTPHTVRRVLEYYAVDYVLLNLTIPQWAEDMLLQDANHANDR